MTVTPEMIETAEEKLFGNAKRMARRMGAEFVLNEQGHELVRQKAIAMSQASPPPQTMERLIDERLSRLPPEHDRTEYAQGKFDVLTELRAALTAMKGTGDAK